MRPHIVWFGEIPLDMERIEREIDRCSVLLVVGTSGAVYPAASFVHWANSRSTTPARTIPGNAIPAATASHELKRDAGCMPLTLQLATAEEPLRT